MERLLRLLLRKEEARPRAPAETPRVWSPPVAGFSTLTTSAPWSASIMVADGPETMPVRSMTRTPCSGPGMAASRNDRRPS